MTEITTSLDWDKVSIDLENAAKRLKRYSPNAKDELKYWSDSKTTVRRRN